MVLLNDIVSQSSVLVQTSLGCFRYFTKCIFALKTFTIKCLIEFHNTFRQFFFNLLLVYCFQILYPCFFFIRSNSLILILFSSSSDYDSEYSLKYVILHYTICSGDDGPGRSRFVKSSVVSFPFAISVILKYIFHCGVLTLIFS